MADRADVNDRIWVVNETAAVLSLKRSVSFRPAVIAIAVEKTALTRRSPR